MSWEVKTMLSKTSSCERTLRRADWRRFWPLLFLYGAVWMMLLPLGLWNRRWSVYNAESLQHALRNIELGDSDPKLSTVLKIAGALQIDMGMLNSCIPILIEI